MLFSLLAIVIDQISKFLVVKFDANITVIKGLLNFTYLQNRGAIFGIMQGSNTIMIILSLIVCFILIWYILKLKKENKKIDYAYYLIISGGIGNCIDRCFRGHVVDFIDTPFIATFNLADSFIVVGVMLILIYEIGEYFKNGK